MEPLARKLREAQARSSLDSVFDETADEQASTSLSSASARAATQLEIYLGEATTSREGKPLKYWGVNKVRFPTLAQMSRSSFPHYAGVWKVKRCLAQCHILQMKVKYRLTADNAEQHLFIKIKIM